MQITRRAMLVTVAYSMWLSRRSLKFFLIVVFMSFRFTGKNFSIVIGVDAFTLQAVYRLRDIFMQMGSRNQTRFAKLIFVINEFRYFLI